MSTLGTDNAKSYAGMIDESLNLTALVLLRVISVDSNKVAVCTICWSIAGKTLRYHGGLLNNSLPLNHRSKDRSRL